jgi:hypothetical protein
MALAAPTMDFSGSPNAGVYATNAAQAQQAYQAAQAALQAKRSRLNNQAGFSVVNNEDGSIKSFSPDGFNPVGQYQQLQHSQGQALDAQHEQDASRGIGTSGIAAQGTSELRYNNAVGQADFGNAFQSANEGLMGEGTANFNTYQNSLLNLQMQAIADARAAQNFPDYGNIDPADYGNPVGLGGGPAGIGTSGGKAASSRIAPMVSGWTSTAPKTKFVTPAPNGAVPHQALDPVHAAVLKLLAPKKAGPNSTMH